MRKWSLGYEVLKVLLSPLHYFFYSNITIIDKDKIPQNTPIIIAPNHQNALMDPLAIIFTSGMQPVFLARSDIFKNKLIASVLNYFRVYPVYRIRDGASSLGKNKEVFNKSAKVLEFNKAMAIFPEASHTEFRSLKKLKKGVPRVAFGAELNNDYKLGVEVVPVGIYYSEYQHLNSNILIKYGNSIKVSDYYDEYKENDQKGMAALRDKLEEEIKTLIVHIARKDHYDFYEQIREINDYSMMKELGLKPGPHSKLIADQKTISKLEEFQDRKPEAFDSLNEKTDNYINDLKQLGIDDCQFDNPPISLFRLLIGSLSFILSLPFHLVGLVLGYIPYKFTESFVSRKIKDTQFRSSFKFVMYMVLMPLWFTIIGLIFYSFIDLKFSFWIIYFGGQILGLFTLRNWKAFTKQLLNWKYYMLIQSGSNEFVRVSEKRRDILNIFNIKYDKK